MRRSAARSPASTSDSKKRKRDSKNGNRDEKRNRNLAYCQAWGAKSKDTLVILLGPGEAGDFIAQARGNLFGAEVGGEGDGIADADLEAS